MPYDFKAVLTVEIEGSSVVLPDHEHDPSCFIAPEYGFQKSFPDSLALEEWGDPEPDDIAQFVIWPYGDHVSLDDWPQTNDPVYCRPICSPNASFPDEGLYSSFIEGVIEE